MRVVRCDGTSESICGDVIYEVKLEKQPQPFIKHIPTLVLTIKEFNQFVNPYIMMYGTDLNCSSIICFVQRLN